MDGKIPFYKLVKLCKQGLFMCSYRSYQFVCSNVHTVDELQLHATINFVLLGANPRHSTDSL